MKTSNWIKRYAQKHTTPDQKYCPIFGIEWNGHNKEYGNYFKIYVPHTGKIYVNETPSIINNGRWRNTLSPRTYGYGGLYVKNIGHGVLEVSRVAMRDGSRGINGERRVWQYEKYCNRIFIDRETLLPYDKYGDRLWKNDDGKYYNKELVKFLGSVTSYGRMSPANLAETLNEFCNTSEIYCGYRNELRTLTQMWHLAEFIRKASERPKSELAVSLASYDLPERKYTETTVEFHPIDDKYAAFRIFKGDSKWDSTLRKYVSTGVTANERCRVFIRCDGKVSVMEKQGDGWNIVAKKLSSVAWIYGDTKNIFDGMYKWNPIKWNMDIIEDAARDKKDNSKEVNGEKIVDYIVKLLRHPVIEKLYKMGYKKLAVLILQNDEVVAYMRSIFYLDKLKEREKNIYKMLGVNKYMLQKIEEAADTHDRYGFNYKDVHIDDIKEIFGTPDITSLSKETIDIYVNGLKGCNYRGWRPLIGDHGYYYWRREKFTNTPSEEKRKILEKLFRIEGTEPGIVSAYADAQGIYYRLHVKPEIDWADFRHLEDVNILHDNLQGLMNAQEAEQRRLSAMRDEERLKELDKKFQKLQEDRVEKFECVGEKYSIITPKNLSEITTEGTSLHHCVGGYLNNHAEGRTNILFLRNNAFPNTPFYTIEVTPDDYVQQIHGKNNRWLGNDPEAISFVWKWIQDRGFRCEKYKLLNTGIGYSRGGNEVSENYLTATA